MVALRRQTFDSLITQVTKVDESVNNLQEAIDFKLVSLIEEEEAKELLEPMSKEVKDIVETV